MRESKFYSISVLAVVLLMMVFIVGCDKQVQDKPVLVTTSPTAPTNPAPSTPTPTEPSTPPVTETTTTPPAETPTAPAPETLTPTIGCVDTDGGLNYTIKGTVTVTQDGSTMTYTDYCRHGNYEDNVLEYYCADNGMTSKTYKCVKGCNNNGACY